VMLKVKAVVGVDTGLTHLAALLSVRSIGIYGSTDVELTGAMGIKHENLKSDLECSPCLSKKCELLDGDTLVPSCYKNLTSEYVAQKILEV